MYCSNCGNKIEDRVKFCPLCGASQSQRNTNTFNTTKTNANNSTINELKTYIESGKKTGNLYKVTGWISAFISLLFLPIIFGALSVITGYLYRDYDEKHGTILIIVGVAFALTGFFLGMGTTVYY